MDSISNSGVSLILNPELAHAIDDHHRPHDLSTCEEEFENPEEIQQMLANAFDSQSLSDTHNDEHELADDDEDEEEEHSPHPNEQIHVQNSSVENPIKSEDFRLLQEENENLRRQLTDSISNEEIYRRRVANYEREIGELNEKHEEKLFSMRLDYETKSEQFTNKLSEQQLEMVTLRQMYETVFDEKCYADERINEMQENEQNLKDKLVQLQITHDQMMEKLNRKTMATTISTQTEIDEENRRRIEELIEQNRRVTDESNRLSEQIQSLERRLNEREYEFTIEKTHYEKRLKDLTKRPLMNCVKLQTDPIEDEESKKLKQLKNELEDYKLKLNSKQIEYNTLKFDFDHLKQEMNDRLSLLATNSSTEQINQLVKERDEYLNELKKLQNELPNLKQQMIDGFQTKMVAFKEQVKKSLMEKDDEYRKRIEQMENEYIAEYEQVLEKNKQMIRSLITSKQEEFNAEKAKIIAEYEEKLKTMQKSQFSDDERRVLEQKIHDLTQANKKCTQYIAKREKSTINSKHHEDLKREHNEEIRRLYDQIAKLNEQQIVLIDEHQKQMEHLKTTYDQRYRVLVDEWKIYNDNLHQSNAKLKTQLKDYEKTIVQLRYHIINLQIEYLQNGGNSKKILSMNNDLK